MSDMNVGDLEVIHLPDHSTWFAWRFEIRQKPEPPNAKRVHVEVDPHTAFMQSRDAQWWAERDNRGAAAAETMKTAREIAEQSARNLLAQEPV